MPTDSLGKSSELKLHCICLFDAYSMPKDMCSVQQWCAGNIYLLVLSSWKVNIDENPIAVIGL